MRLVLAEVHDSVCGVRLGTTIALPAQQHDVELARLEAVRLFGECDHEAVLEVADDCHEVSLGDLDEGVDGCASCVLQELVVDGRLDGGSLEMGSDWEKGG